MSAKKLPWNILEERLYVDGPASDGKRLFLFSSENDGWRDLRIEVDTDDVDSKIARKWVDELIRRYNHPMFRKGKKPKPEALDYNNSFTGEPCTYDEMVESEIERLMEKDD